MSTTPTTNDENDKNDKTTSTTSHSIYMWVGVVGGIIVLSLIGLWVWRHYHNKPMTMPANYKDLQMFQKHNLYRITHEGKASPELIQMIKKKQ